MGVRVSECVSGGATPRQGEEFEVIYFFINALGIY